MNYILSELPVEGWLWDKPLYVDFHGGCCASKRRIDLRILVEHDDQSLFWLGIEIDENQHKSYAADYETDRYNDLFMDFSGKYVFIRINPNGFKQQGKRIDPPFEERVPAVMSLIEDIISNGPRSTDLVEVHHLFYDDC